MASSLNELKVLVVEDSPAAAKLLQMVLAGLGIHQSFVAQDGKAAQDFLDAADDLVDIIICDWQMPRMSGLELLCQVRTVYPDMPFMMVTGNNDIESVKIAKQSGVNAYITKPFSAAQVQSKLLAITNKMCHPIVYSD
jgi:two-component system chemotaxis response regulator CheY